MSRTRYLIYRLCLTASPAKPRLLCEDLTQMWCHLYIYRKLHILLLRPKQDRYLFVFISVFYSHFAATIRFGFLYLKKEQLLWVFSR